jgi:hypothetical protein
LVHIRGILKEVRQGEEVAFEHHAQPGIIDRRAEFLQRLSQGRKLQTIRVYDGLKVFPVKLPSENLLAGDLEVEKEHRRREYQDKRSENH